MSDRKSKYALLFYSTLSGVVLGVLSFVNHVHNSIILTDDFAVHRYRNLSIRILFCALIGLLTALCLRGVLLKRNIIRRISSGFIFLLLLMVWLLIFAGPFIRFGEPVILSDSGNIQERGNIKGRIWECMLITPPDNSQDLYFSYPPALFFTDFFAAFCLPSEEECEAFFEKERMPLDKFQEGNFSSEGLWDEFLPPPHTWGQKYQDSNWRLSNDSRFLYYGDGYQLVIYVPDEHRIYIYDDGSP